MNISALLQALMGGSQGTGMSVSGLQQMDPSGSTPQPAPLSGLPLAANISGVGGTGGLSGTSQGSMSGGQQAGPGLDFFQQMLDQMHGGENIDSLTPPNLSSLFSGLGQGGIGQDAFSQALQGLQGGIGSPPWGDPNFVDVGMRRPNPVVAGQQSGASGSMDPLALIQQALGAAQKGVGLAQTPQGPPGAPGGGEGLAGGSPTAPPEGGVLGSVDQGSLVNSFLSDPGIGQLFNSGMLTESMFPPDLWSSFQQDPAFLHALTTGVPTEGLSNLDTSGWGGNLNLNDPFGGLGGAAGGADWLGSVGSGLGGLGSLFGLAQDAKSGNALGLVKDLYGAYSAGNSLFGLGGPTISSLLGNLGSSLFGGAAGAGLGATEAGIGLGAGAVPAAGIGEGATLLGEGALSGLGGMASIAALPFMMEMMNTGSQTADKRQSVIHELMTAARNAPVVSGQLGLAGQGMSKLQGATPDVLRQIIQNYGQAQGGMSQMAAPTAAAGTKAAGINHPSYQWLQDQYQRVMPSATLAMIRAYDRLSNAGENILPANLRAAAFDKGLVDTGGGFYAEDPNSGYHGPMNPDGSLPSQYGAGSFMDFVKLVRSKAGLSGDPFAIEANWDKPSFDIANQGNPEWTPGPIAMAPQYQAIVDAAKPGSYEQSLNQLFGAANPNYAQSPWSQLANAPQQQANAMLQQIIAQLGPQFGSQLFSQFGSRSPVPQPSPGGVPAGSGSAPSQTIPASPPWVTPPGAAGAGWNDSLGGTGFYDFGMEPPPEVAQRYGWQKVGGRWVQGLTTQGTP